MAPIAVFVYKRPEHSARLLQSLLQNAETASSPLYIFCDGARNPADADEVRATRQAARSVAPRHAVFVEQELNVGLAGSIIAGVSRLTREYGRVIVLEDDLVLSPHALRYFNDALDRYADAERVMHVSGYMFPVDASLPETFFYREATCWGWATWARAWAKFEPDGRRIRDHVVERGMQHEFDVQGSMGFLNMLNLQIHGSVNSWAIRWYGSMRMAQGLALHPGKSLVQNHGFDGTGEHCSTTTAFDVRLNQAPVRRFADRIEENEDALRAMIAYRQRLWGNKPPLVDRARAYLRRVMGRA